MISISESAQNYFLRLIENQGIPDLGIRIKVLRAGTPTADCQLEFCEKGDLQGDEWLVDGINWLYLEEASAAFLESAQIDYQTHATGGQLTIKAPRLKGEVPGVEASLADRVRYILESEINPQIASHGGRVHLTEIDASGAVFLQFGGGCHGCGMADVTLKEGIERTLRERIPEITAVRDATDHTTGKNPYFQGKAEKTTLA